MTSKRGFTLLVILILLTPLASSLETWNLDSEEVLINLKIEQELEVIPESSTYQLDYVTVNLSFVPKESFRQEVTSMVTQPEADLQDNVLIFRWEDPSQLDLKASLDADMRISGERKKIKKKIPFPIDQDSLPDDIRAYLEATETIDITQEMSDIASAAIEGEDDLYKVTNLIADWVESSIRYDLNTIAAKASLSSSWVLENRYGVCDEITSLYISMLRSVGIPAKFVSGISYTNSEDFTEHWGPHGWAEVYFPEVGWVPFDVTYDQFGYIDPTHIKLKESQDPGESTSRYEWRGRRVSLTSKETLLEADLTGYSGDQPDRIRLTPRAYEADIGFGSYQLMIVEIENLVDYYVSSTIYMSKSDITTLLDKKQRAILAPREKTTLFFMIKATSDLDEGYEYRLPITFYTQDGIEESAEIFLKKAGQSFSQQEMENIRDGLDSSSEKTYSEKVDVSCTWPSEAQIDKEIDIICKFKNKGNKNLRLLNLCLKEECQETSLNINQEKELSFGPIIEQTGTQELLLTLNNQDISSIYKMPIIGFDKVDIEIIDIVNPASTSYDQIFNVSFIVNKNSAASPKDVTLRMRAGNYQRETTTEEIARTSTYVFKMNSKDLKIGQNEIGIEVSYIEDDTLKTRYGKSYISLENLTFLQKIIIWIKTLFK